eukprot:gene15686-20780_t
MPSPDSSSCRKPKESNGISPVNHFQVRLLLPRSGRKFRERGFEVDHSSINRWVLSYAPMIETRLRQFRKPPYLREKSRSMALSEPGHRQTRQSGGFPADGEATAAKRFFRKMLKDERFLSPGKIGTDGANTFPSTIKTSVEEGLPHPDRAHYVTKHLQQGIESDHFRVKKTMPKVGGYSGHE